MRTQQQVHTACNEVSYLIQSTSLWHGWLHSPIKEYLSHYSCVLWRTSEQWLLYAFDEEFTAVWQLATTCNSYIFVGPYPHHLREWSPTSWRMISQFLHLGGNLIQMNSNLIFPHGKYICNGYTLRDNPFTVGQRIFLTNKYKWLSETMRRTISWSIWRTESHGLVCLSLNGYFSTHNEYVWCPSNKGASPSINSTLV